MERRLLTGALLIFLLSGFFIGINIYYKNTVEKPIFGGTLKEGMVGQPAFINPLVSATNDIDSDLISIIYSNLDDLVKNYQISEDNKIWTITLKDKLTWSDSEPITSDDILFTIETVQNPNNNHPLFPTWRGVVVERLNENEIRLTLKTPYVFLIDNFKELKIAPQHIFGSIPPSNFRLSRYNIEPIGSGPYKIAKLEIKKNGFISDYELKPNEMFNGQKPYIEKIIFKFYENEDELIKAFNQKEIDAIAGLDQKYLQELKVSHQILTINLPRYYALFFNPSSNSPIKDKSVRKALAMSVNKEELVSKIFGKQTMIISGPLPPNINGYDQSVFQEEIYNPEAATDLLDKASWTKNNEGVRMELNVIVPQIPFLIETANLIKDGWEKIGVRMNLIALDPNEINDSIIRTRNYEALIFGNILKKNPDVFSFWHSSERFYPGRNLSLYSDKKTDDLLESIRQDFNSSSRNQKLSELQKIINENTPAAFLFSPNYLYAIPKDLRGYQSYFIASPSDRFEDINKWYLKTSRVTNE